jgi:hypothetical protein
MAKKVLRYTESEFVTLLESIVKRVKREERLEESKNRVSENRNHTSKSSPNRRRRA